MEHKIDRISELPDPILEHIVSFIPTKQLLQLSVLSKRWENVWTLFPIPEFVQHLFINNLRKVPPNEKEEEIQRKKDEFKSFVERSLRGRHRQRLSIN
jgi:ubiquitin-protein ligase